MDKITLRMKQPYLKWLMSVLLLVVAYVHPRAQIILHEAADITQTKATLSAEFPDITVDHGFQYKYGILPELDELAKVALSTTSEPLELTTYGNAWTPRISKGWVESSQNLPVGDFSMMACHVSIYEDN